MPTVRQVQQLIQQGDYTFSVDLKNVYLLFPIVKHHHQFVHSVWQHRLHQWKVLPFGLATAPRVFTLLTKPILFLFKYRGFHMNIFGSYPVPDLHKACRQEGMSLFCALYCFVWDYIFIFQSELFQSQQFSFWGYDGIQWTCLYLCHLTLSQDTSSDSFFVIEAACYSLSGYVILGQDHLLCQGKCTNPTVL